MKFLLYGATGYTGQLIAAHASSFGLTPILAGRSESKVKAMAESMHLDYRVFDLSDTNVDDVKSSVITIVSPANSNLFSTLRSSLDLIYGPMIDDISHEEEDESASESKWYLTESAKHLIMELENELACTVAPKAITIANDVHDISCIRTPLDEIHFWEKFDGGEKYRNSSELLNSHFSEVKNTFQLICNCSLDSNHDPSSCEDVDIAGYSVSNSLSWVENEFGDRGNVEGALYNVFLVRCTAGDFIYSSKVRPFGLHAL